MTKIATIIGYGDRGQSWARHAVKAGWDVRVFDPQGKLDALHSQVAQHDLISTAVRDSDLILLCLPDRLDLKRKIIQLIQTQCTPDTILSVMSALSKADDIQDGAKWPGSVMHISIADDDVVTVNTTARNSEQAVSRLKDEMQHLGFETKVIEASAMAA